MNQEPMLILIESHLAKLVEYARIADIRGRAIAEMWEKTEKKQRAETITVVQSPSQTILHESSPVIDKRAYDWWRLENGTYAKVYRTILEGEIYQEDGVPSCKSNWNPLSLKNTNGITDFNLKSRKSGDNPSGWPDWCK
jgi:hypothetical protein